MRNIWYEHVINCYCIPRSPFSQRIAIYQDSRRVARCGPRCARGVTQGEAITRSSWPQVRLTHGITRPSIATGASSKVMPEVRITPPGVRATVYSTWVVVKLLH